MSLFAARYSRSVLFATRFAPQRVTELYKRNTICSTVKELQSYTNSTRFAPQSKRYRAIQTRVTRVCSRGSTVKELELHKRNAICSKAKELQSDTNRTRSAPQSTSYRAIQTQREFAPEAERYSAVRTGNIFIRNAICSTGREVHRYLHLLLHADWVSIGHLWTRRSTFTRFRFSVWGQENFYRGYSSS